MHLSLQSPLPVPAPEHIYLLEEMSIIHLPRQHRLNTQRLISHNTALALAIWGYQDTTTDGEDDDDDFPSSLWTFVNACKFSDDYISDISSIQTIQKCNCIDFKSYGGFSWGIHAFHLHYSYTVLTTPNETTAVWDHISTANVQTTVGSSLCHIHLPGLSLAVLTGQSESNTTLMTDMEGIMYHL